MPHRHHHGQRTHHESDFSEDRLRKVTRQELAEIERKRLNFEEEAALRRARLQLQRDETQLMRARDERVREMDQDEGEVSQKEKSVANKCCKSFQVLFAVLMTLGLLFVVCVIIASLVGATPHFDIFNLEQPKFIEFSLKNGDLTMNTDPSSKNKPVKTIIRNGSVVPILKVGADTQYSADYNVVNSGGKFVLNETESKNNYEIPPKILEKNDHIDSITDQEIQYSENTRSSLFPDHIYTEVSSNPEQINVFYKHGSDPQLEQYDAFPSSTYHVTSVPDSTVQILPEHVYDLVDIDRVIDKLVIQNKDTTLHDDSIYQKSFTPRSGYSYSQPDEFQDIYRSNQKNSFNKLYNNGQDFFDSHSSDHENEFNESHDSDKVSNFVGNTEEHMTMQELEKEIMATLYDIEKSSKITRRIDDLQQKPSSVNKRMMRNDHIRKKIYRKRLTPSYVRRTFTHMPFRRRKPYRIKSMNNNRRKNPENIEENQFNSYRWKRNKLRNKFHRSPAEFRYPKNAENIQDIIHNMKTEDRTRRFDSYDHEIDSREPILNGYSVGEQDHVLTPTYLGEPEGSRIHERNSNELPHHSFEHHDFGEVLLENHDGTFDPIHEEIPHVDDHHLQTTDEPKSSIRDKLYEPPSYPDHGGSTMAKKPYKVMLDIYPVMEHNKGSYKTKYESKYRILDDVGIGSTPKEEFHIPEPIHKDNQNNNRRYDDHLPRNKQIEYSKNYHNRRESNHKLSDASMDVLPNFDDGSFRKHTITLNINLIPKNSISDFNGRAGRDELSVNIPLTRRFSAMEVFHALTKKGDPQAAYLVDTDSYSTRRMGETATADMSSEEKLGLMRALAKGLHAINRHLPSNIRFGFSP